LDDVEVVFTLRSSTDTTIAMEMDEVPVGVTLVAPLLLDKTDNVMFNLLPEVALLTSMVILPTVLFIVTEAVPELETVVFVELV
jgi:hypothetical protein